MLHPTPNLLNLLSQRKLIDQFSIVATLTEDLSQKAVFIPERKTQTPLSKRARREVVVVSRPSSSSAKVGVSPRMRSLRELEEESSIDETEAKGGFLDEKSGEVIYLIERIIKYEPAHGYLVHWQGYGKSERTWQSPRDMPAIFGSEMKQARDRYRDTKREDLDETAIESTFKFDDSNISVPPENKLSLTELKTRARISDSEARRGILDANGEVLYIVRRIVEFDPKRGYLIDWQGYAPADQTWNRAMDMPNDKEVRGWMKQMILFPTPAVMEVVNVPNLGVARLIAAINEDLQGCLVTIKDVNKARKKRKSN